MFKTFYGFSNAKIKVLIRKTQADGVSIEEDMRGRHRNNTIRLLPEARRQSQISSFRKKQLSHTTEERKLKKSILTVINR